MTDSTEEDKQDWGKRYLLILPCSKRKRSVPTAPATDLYDGPFYRILRKQKLPNLDVLILSAKYGLIEADRIIVNYDQKMTGQRARELSQGVKEKLEEAITIGRHKEVFVNLGSRYMTGLCASKNVLDRCNASYATGPIGKRLHQLKVWLIDLQKEVNHD